VATSGVAPAVREAPDRTPERAASRIIDGILWALRTGAPWHDLPARYGPIGTVSSRFYLYGLLPLRKRSLG
jgi:transposase